MSAVTARSTGRSVRAQGIAGLPGAVAPSVSAGNWPAAGSDQRTDAMREDAVKFGISYNTGYYGTGPDNMVAVARHAEDCGFESFYVSEHIALYPGAKTGAVEFPPSLAVADPLECLSVPGPDA